MIQLFQQKHAWFLILVFFSSQMLWGTRFEPQPEVIFYSSKVGKMSLKDFTYLSFLLSGASSQEIPVLEKQLDEIIQNVRTKVKLIHDLYHKADQILFLLHQDLFKVYRPLQTQVDRVLQTGDFNCVSSVLLYMIVSLNFGFVVQAIATTDHVLCQLMIDGRSYDVETTTAFGFDPGQKKEFLSNFGSTTGFVYVPPGQYSTRKALDKRGILGLMLQNRAVAYQKERRFDEAIGLAVDRWYLEKTPQAKKALIETINNYSSFLNSRKEYLQGLSLIERALMMTENDPSLYQLLGIFYRNQAIEWNNQHDWDKAIAFYSEAWKKNHISNNEYQKMCQMLFNNALTDALDKDDFPKAQSMVNAWFKKAYITQRQETVAQERILTKELSLVNKRLSLDQAIQRIEKSYLLNRISLAKRRKFLNQIYGQEAQRIAKTYGYWEALQYLEALSPEIRNQPPLEEIRKTYSYNWSVEAYNHFLQLESTGEKQKAIDFLKESLRKLPSSSLLQQAWAKVST